jgi:Tol biopolymer transport system component
MPTWLNAGPRGIHFTSDFQLVQILRDEEAYYADFKLGADGKNIYALRMPSYPERYATLVRLYGSEEEQLQREEVLNFSELTDPALWDPGIDLSGAVIGVALFNSGDDLLSVASNGDLFLAVGAWSGDSARGDPPLGVSLIILHPDESRQKVLTIRELGEAGLLDLTNADRGASLAAVASAPDRLWVKTEIFPIGAVGFSRFYQVQDPNGDGDWSDRTILPLSLPAFLLAGEGEEEWEWWHLQQMVAEPSLGGEDHSRSFLLPAISQRGEFRIYRISDLNHDGDALDAGEFDLLFEGFTASPEAHVGRPVIIEARVIMRSGELVLREMVVSSITGLSRVSRLSEAGELMDIARAFPNFEDLLTDTEGNIYIVTQLPRLDEEGTQFVMYKLRPLAEGEKAEPAAVAATTEPSITPELVTGAITPEVPRIAFTRAVYGPGEEKREVFIIGADGSGPSKLVEGAHNWLCCQSPGGSRMFYFSDEEVPHEQFVYVANADGSNPEKVTESPRVSAICSFSEERLLLIVRTGAPATLIRHDLESGEETTLLMDVPEWSVSPEGRHLAFVSGLDYTTIPTIYLPRGEESLEVLDLETGERRLLHGPLTGTSYHRLWWSPNGQRVGYLIGPWRHKQNTISSGDFDLYVTDLLSGDTKLVYRAEGVHPWPSVTWSPTGSWLLVEMERERLLVNVETGEARPWQVEGENVVRYGWAPNEDSLVYRVGQTLYSQSVDGDERKLTTVFGDECPGCDSIGWSPDGRYIGLSDYWQTIAILDTTTGETRILFREEEENAFIFPYGWWQ